MRKEQPERTCAACRARRPQVVLVRMARGCDGSVVVDEYGQKRSFGRGVYLCPDERCITLAKKRQTLRRALHAEVSDMTYDEIRRVARHCAS